MTVATTPETRPRAPSEAYMGRCTTHFTHILLFLLSFSALVFALWKEQDLKRVENRIELLEKRIMAIHMTTGTLKMPNPIYVNKYDADSNSDEDDITVKYLDSLDPFLQPRHRSKRSLAARRRSSSRRRTSSGSSSSSRRTSRKTTPRPKATYPTQPKPVYTQPPRYTYPPSPVPPKTGGGYPPSPVPPKTGGGYPPSPVPPRAGGYPPSPIPPKTGYPAPGYPSPGYPSPGYPPPGGKFPGTNTNPFGTNILKGGKSSKKKNIGKAIAVGLGAYAGAKVGKKIVGKLGKAAFRSMLLPHAPFYVRSHRRMRLNLGDDYINVYGFNGVTSAAHYDGKTSSNTTKIRHEEDLFKNWKEAGWMQPLKMSEDFRLQNGIVTVSESGLYLLYAQVHYVEKEFISGFQIFVDDDPIAMCVTMATTNITATKHNTCFTSTMSFLGEGSRVYLSQLQSDRTCMLDKGSTFFGLINLGDPRTAFINDYSNAIWH